MASDIDRLKDQLLRLNAGICSLIPLLDKIGDPISVIDGVTINYDIAELLTKYNSLVENMNAVKSEFNAEFAKGNPSKNISMTIDEVRAEKYYLLWKSMSPDYIYKHYDSGTQSTFLARYIKMSVDPVLNANKIAMLDSVDAWISSIFVYYYSKKYEISTAVDINGLNGITWDFTQFDVTNPQITIPQIL